MKVPYKIAEDSTSGIKLGIVRLGPAAGKLKYTLLDKQDMDLVQKLWFKPYVDIDKNGNGARIYAYVYDGFGGQSAARPVHNLLWERHYGGIAPGFKVIHKNGITVDNRLENLILCPLEQCNMVYSNIKCHKDSLYWTALEKMPYEILPSHLTFLSPSEEEQSLGENRFYECHYLPCTKIEQNPHEFSICSQCQVTRYCGLECQELDWPYHKSSCYQRLFPLIKETFPDR